MQLHNIYETYKNEPYFQVISSHIYERYQEIEICMQETFQYVTPNTSNRCCHSSMFSRILRDVGSTFGSTLKELINKSGNSNNCTDNINGYYRFIKRYIPNIDKRVVLFRHNRKMLLPFKESCHGIPIWWHAYNKVKHKEVSDYKEGNLENALTAIAALAILGRIIAPSMFPSTHLFANLGIAYPLNAVDVSQDRLMFP